MTNKTGNSLFNALVFLALVLTLAAVLLSAWLRLDSIGLGCADWPACFGLIPDTRDHGLVPASMAGAVHRFTASLLGLIVVAITYLALRGRRPATIGVAAPLTVFALTLFLSVLGYSTPSPDIPAVTFGNLLGGMAMLALLWWMSQRGVETTPDDSRNRALRPWAWLGLVVVTLQIALGAITSASFAGPACTSLPGCEGNWASMAGLVRGLDLLQVLPVDGHGRIVTGDMQKTLHMAHRLGAALALLYLGWLALRALRLDYLRTTAVTLLALLAIQVLLGASAVMFELPLPLVTAHNAVAAMLLLTTVNLYHLLTPALATQTSPAGK